MSSMLNLIIKGLWVCCLGFSLISHAAKCDANEDATLPRLSRGEQTSDLCFLDAGGVVQKAQLGFELNRSRLLLKIKGRKFVIEHVGRH